MLFRQKYLSLFIVVMMFFMIASGGCGGGGSSNSSNRTNPNNPNPVNPNPDNPNQDNPETEYDISVLAGTWLVSEGTATMTGSDENFNLITAEDGGSFSFSNIQINGNIASIDMEGETYWEYQNGSRLGTGHRQGYRKEVREFQHIGGNIWRRVFNKRTTTITITSPTTVKFEEEEIDEVVYGPQGETSSHHWIARFTLTKQDSTREYDIVTTLAGTWVASNGTAAMTDADDNVDLENFDLTIQEDGTHFEFSNIQLNGNTASIDMYGHTHWEYRSGSRTGKTHGMDYDLGKTRQFQHVSGNTWRCVNTAPYPDQTINPEETITITITSPTTVEIEEKRNFEVWNNRKQAMDEGVYQWTASFTLTKEDELN